MNNLLIVGLGNPGVQYAATRHNLGFMVADKLAERYNSGFKDGFKGLWGEFRADEKHFILKPMTYMNLSGQSVVPFMSFYKIEPESLLVIQDDLDMEFGRIKFRNGGSSGGHNGIKSIIELLGTDKFVRLKMGIGKSRSGGTVGHVLGRFEDKEQLEKFVELGTDSAEAFVKGGLKSAMNTYNNKSIFDDADTPGKN
ncbi:aminoacyl-tRNA hydrolase [Geovibrio sp. ADMFC3]